MKSRAAGFTLIELLITLAILGLLSSLVIPLSQLAVQRMREKELKDALWQIRRGIDAYKQASDEGRISKPVGDNGYPRTLDTLVDGVVDQRDPQHRKMYFLRRVPRNPMFPDSDASDAMTWMTRSYLSEPSDPQEGDDVYDIYSGSPSVGLNGVPYRQW